MFWQTYVKLCEQNGSKPQPTAISLGIKSGSVTKWKNGAMPSVENLKKISSHFGVTIDYLLYGENRFDDSAEEEDKKLLELFHKLSKQQRRDFIGALRVQLNMAGAADLADRLEGEPNALNGTRA